MSGAGWELRDLHITKVLNSLERPFFFYIFILQTDLITILTLGTLKLCSGFTNSWCNPIQLDKSESNLVMKTAICTFNNSLLLFVAL